MGEPFALDRPQDVNQPAVCGRAWPQAIKSLLHHLYISPRVSLWKYTGAGEYDFSARGAARARHAEDADAPGDLVLGDQACEPPRLGLGFGRIVVSEIEVPNVLANLL
jgi:hypothetical protein